VKAYSLLIVALFLVLYSTAQEKTEFKRSHYVGGTIGFSGPQIFHPKSTTTLPYYGITYKFDFHEKWSLIGRISSNVEKFERQVFHRSISDTTKIIRTNKSKIWQYRIEFGANWKFHNHFSLSALLWSGINKNYATQNDQGYQRWNYTFPSGETISEWEADPYISYAYNGETYVPTNNVQTQNLSSGIYTKELDSHNEFVYGVKLELNTTISVSKKIELNFSYSPEIQLTTDPSPIYTIENFKHFAVAQLLYKIGPA
jgi:hypothetical protein